MHTVSTTTPSPTTIAPRKRAVIRAATVGAVAATVVNVALWGIGRVAGASFVVDPGLGEPNLEVGVIKVILTTLVPFAVGAALLALAARWSRRWVAVLAVVAGVFAVVSAVGPLDGGHDTGTGVLLATMHVTTGAAFVLAAMGVQMLRHAPS
ncbi:hypothetical protein ER308_04085 [Egibacter rhizosphaerae]|uniref:Uncharacterized protein n=1 Tax=Egibacter rhizosphaerae TaxID=1670831 RepID=A0A411YC92_9ACTN|nr:DUF6069 family protein [Egibacter rhizosphaerae]QBI18806.1 hypothetical protein ER308_04085 [Egibacter rhizosphaerae]